MKKMPARKLSALGVVILAASAVTAAVLPGKSKDVKFEGSIDNGTLRSLSGIGGGGRPLSCVADTPDFLFSCHLTQFTVTTGGLISDAQPFLTGNPLCQTSDSTPGNGIDTTSKPFVCE